MVYDDCEGFVGHVWLVLLAVFILMLDGEGYGGGYKRIVLAFFWRWERNRPGKIYNAGALFGLF